MEKPIKLVDSNSKTDKTTSMLSPLEELDYTSSTVFPYFSLKSLIQI